jgi:hypothetical protein
MKYVGKWGAGQLASGVWKYPNGTNYEGSFD